MSEIKNETIKVEQDKTIEIKREIYSYLTYKTGQVYVKLKVSNNTTGEFIRWEFYNFDATDIAQEAPTGKSRYEDNKSVLWGKINEIDAMPESTEEEIHAKQERKNGGWKVIIN